MFGKHSLFLLLLLAAVLGPMAYYNDWPNMLSLRGSNLAAGNLATIPARSTSSFDLSPNGLTHQVSTIQVAPQTLNNEINPSRIGLNSPPASPIPANAILPGNASGPDFNAVPLEFMPVANLGEIFRFDANPAWVKQRWDRVSITKDKPGLNGLRVPLVTGVNTSDLFGSLTYYFDNRQQLQKLTFRGWTGNPAGLVNFVIQNYGFKNQPTSSAGLYLAKSWTKSTGALYMQHPNYVSSKNPTQQIAILMEINNPNGPFKLSTEVASMIFNSQR